jgi:hypothetical protein
VKKIENAKLKIENEAPAESRRSIFNFQFSIRAIAEVRA